MVYEVKIVRSGEVGSNHWNYCVSAEGKPIHNVVGAKLIDDHYLLTKTRLIKVSWWNGLQLAKPKVQRLSLPFGIENKSDYFKADERLYQKVMEEAEDFIRRNFGGSSINKSSVKLVDLTRSEHQII